MTDTQHYQLNQWAADDQVLRMDFNADNAKIDAALGEHAQKLNWLGNCRIETGTYVGTGEYGENHANSLAFGGKPVLVIIGGGASEYFLAARGSNSQVYTIGSVMSNTMQVTWTSNSISWYAGSADEHQQNGTGRPYTLVAFLVAE